MNGFKMGTSYGLFLEISSVDHVQLDGPNCDGFEQLSHPAYEIQWMTYIARRRYVIAEVTAQIIASDTFEPVNTSIQRSRRWNVLRVASVPHNQIAVEAKRSINNNLK